MIGAPQKTPLGERVDDAVARARRALHLPPRPESGGNDVRFLASIDAIYPQMLALIANATRSVHLEFYIFDDDLVGQRFMRALAMQARRGVAVRMVIDAVGSYRTRRSTLDYLREAGVELVVFNPPRFAPLSVLTRRNHRKLLVVDQSVAVVGGMNISRVHIPRPHGDAWLDCACVLRGLSAQDLAYSFARMYRRLPAARGKDGVDLVAARPQRSEANNPGQVWVQDNAWYSRRYLIRDTYVREIRRAQRTIELAHAYFVPDAKLLRALRAAVQRGVRVRLLLPGPSDVPIVKRAMEALYESYFRWGVELREWPHSMLHSKLAVFDGEVFTCGSYNLDDRSLRKNLELVVWVRGCEAVRTVSADFEANWQAAAPVLARLWARRSWWQRLRERVAYYLRKRF